VYNHKGKVIAIDQWKKDWKVQKVAILNTCCNVTCLTLQLSHITAGLFQSQQHLKERSKPSVGRKSVAFHKSAW